MRAKKYVHDESVVTYRKNWKRFEKKKSIMGGIFYNMKALFMMDDPDDPVSRKSSDNRDGPRWQNAGVLFKLYFTFLIDKLLKPGENIKWKNYIVFEKRVQDLALKRRTWRKKQKVKLEQEKWKREQENYSDVICSDEEDLETVKQMTEAHSTKSERGTREVLCGEEPRIRYL